MTEPPGPLVDNMQIGTHGGRSTCSLTGRQQEKCMCKDTVGMNAKLLRATSTYIIHCNDGH